MPFIIEHILFIAIAGPGLLKKQIRADFLDLWPAEAPDFLAAVRQ